MRSVYLNSLLVLFFALSFRQFPAQDGFISLDCGLPDRNGYIDSSTGLFYSPDDDYVVDGVGNNGQIISRTYQTASLQRQYTYLRSFPGPVGTRGCYALQLQYGKGYQMLVRVGFMYGNYDGKNQSPEFDLYLGANHWETVKVNDTDPYFFVTEVLHKPTSGSLDICVVNTGNGTPFISLIELRPMNLSSYNTSSGSLKSLIRFDMGSSATIRYKDDLNDRIWNPTPKSLASTTTLTTSPTPDIFTNGFAISSKILSTAIEAPNQSDSLNISFRTVDQVFMYFHFAELIQLNGTRQVNLYLNGQLWYGPLNISYRSINTVYIPRPDPPGQYSFSIQATANSSAPAILNAFEAYTVTQFPLAETDEMDVAAIKDIKNRYNVTKNWQGDPCYPRYLTWTGVNCSYSNGEPPSIISLNLSSSGLVGGIHLAIYSLKKLQSLDLSYNNLSGQVPEFLAWLPSLKYLYLTGNKIDTSLPPALEEKSRNGSLRIYFQSTPPNPPNQTHCGDGGDPCPNKKKNITVIVASTVCSIIGFVAAVLTVIYVVLKQKRKAGKKVPIVPSKVTSFPYSEVRNVIGDNKIIGSGGFGTVYYGWMRGVEVAVKVFNSLQELRNRDFQSEVKILATVYHKNLTRIIGYCDEGPNKAIILEFIENGNLQYHLSDTNPNVLSWTNRLSILAGAGEGLEYLHHGCKPKIIHRDIKPENVLLTNDFEAKLADFGFSRNFPFQSSTVVGTYGYHDPQYDDPSMLTEKVDVYSFGVLMLTVITGKAAIERGTHVTRRISHFIQNGDIRRIVDARLKENYNPSVAWKVVELAMACVSTEPSRRPDMHFVVRELKECLQIIRYQYDQDVWQSPNAEIVLPSSVMSSEIVPSTR